ncbi:hypothetical protein Clacol_005444 [Clathrus columnatus]|uniref:DNA polymerase n=1 Tax=Clathrus columnatus TaxID=1419009 RepID=A0AAV5AC20_9AGAM|nr:hypothetical protein Clacol_005444 [Clathrus columnatus]
MDHSKENNPPLSSQTDGHTLKKRKLAGNSVELVVQESFTEVLERLRDDSSASSGAEGGSDAWARPALGKIDTKKNTIIFQQIDIEETQDTDMPLRMFGVTKDGHSVMANVRGFLPYFYVPAPRDFSEEHLKPFMDAVNRSLQFPMVDKVERVSKYPLLNYRGEKPVWFIKLVVQNQRSLPKVRDNSGLTLLNSLRLFESERDPFRFRDFNFGNATYESNIPYTLRYLLRHLQIVGMNWIEVPAGKYELVSRKISHCQVEISMKWDAFISHAPEGEWSMLAPFRILSFDIECAGRRGVFPEASIDPIIQIGNMVTRQGEFKPFIRNVFTLDTCAHIVGSQVISFDKEDDLLMKWRDFVQEIDPDIIIGYNIANFDFPYLLDRASALKLGDFSSLGRIQGSKSKLKDTHFSSRAFGQRDSKETIIEGRLQLDLLQFMQREHKLRSYTLNSVCAQFLGEQKEDVHHSIITELQNGTPESRRRLAVYCLKVQCYAFFPGKTLRPCQDAYLPQRLLDKLMCLVNYTEMARVTGVPFNYLLSRGQSIKVLSQLYRKANQDNYIIPAMKGDGNDEQYEGATVIEPLRGYYDVPIATLDFSSLYPSIMMAHNLCYTTLLDQTTINSLDLKQDVDYFKTPTNDAFVSPTRRKGLLPTILEDLLTARKRAKADLKKETDPFKRAVLDGRQLALKISANSEVESHYSVANGYDHDAQVIYGDTDSVMVKFGTNDLSEAMRLGSEAAGLVTTKFLQPIKLEFEKVYFPYLLINKKRYAGLYWTRPEKYDKMDSKGIETVRRDNCRLVQTVIETCLHKLLIDRDVKGAENFVKRTIADLLQNKVDMSQLVITKALAKADYTAKQPHVELAERMKQRDAGSAPALGDRVAYVIIKGARGNNMHLARLFKLLTLCSLGAAAYEKSEDPIYVLENNIPIDTKYYLDNQLSKPLLRIFEPILGEKAQSLLAGEHTRTIQIATPSVGGLMKYAVKTITCLGCKTALKPSNSVKGMLTETLTDGAVCNNCRPKLGELYIKQVNSASQRQVQFARLWTQCQRCQGSLHQDVLCTSKDCPIFYMRKKAQKDVEDVVAVLDRFNQEIWTGLGPNLISKQARDVDRVETRYPFQISMMSAIHIPFLNSIHISISAHYQYFSGGKILDGGVAWEEKITLCQSQSGGWVLDFSKTAVFVSIHEHEDPFSCPYFNSSTVSTLNVSFQFKIFQTKKLISQKLQSQEMNIRDFIQLKASSVDFPDGSRLMFCLEQLSNTEFMKKAIKDSGLPAVTADAPEPPEVMVPTRTSTTPQQNIWEQFMSYFENVVCATKPLAEFSLSPQNLLHIYQILQSLHTSNHAILELSHSLLNVYEYIQDAAHLKQCQQSQVISDLALQTVECIQVLRLSQAKFYDEHLDHFNNVFDNLKREMSELLSLQMAVMLTNIYQGIENTVQTLNDTKHFDKLKVIPYTGGSGFKPEESSLPETHQTIIDNICGWIIGLDDKQVCLLISSAGSGKTAVANTITQLFEVQQWLGSFVSFRQAKIKAEELLFCTVARDLTDINKDFREALVKLISSGLWATTSTSMDIQFKRLIVDPLKHLDIIGPIIIVIDGLDKDKESSGRTFITTLPILMKYSSHLPFNYRFLITSRPHPKLQTWQESLSDEERGRILCKRMEEVNRAETTIDIAKYFLSQLSQHAGNLVLTLGNSWQLLLAQRAEGYFQWARAACDFIDDCSVALDLGSKARYLLSHSPSTMNTYYNDILMLDPKFSDTSYLQSFKRTMAMLMNAGAVPYTIRHLQYRLSIPNKVLMMIMSSINPLFPGAHDLDIPLRPVHSSFFEFLKTSTVVNQENYFYVNIQEFNQQAVNN